ncbi:MAG: hypothetical protein ACI8S6_001787 [Myxococcota bacterium]|jgi:hypothetical protein
MVLLMLGLAWGDALRVPGGQATAWEDALALTGLTLAEPMEEAIAELRVVDGQWELRVRSGSEWRSTTVEPPTTPERREAIARLVLLMRAERDVVAHPWALQGEPMHLEPVSIEPVPAPVPRSPAWIPPPRFSKSAPELGPIAVVVYPSLTPEQVVSYPAVLRPVSADLDGEPEVIVGGWGWIGGGGALRPETSARPGAQAAGGVQLRSGWRPGLGGSWQGDAPLLALGTIDGSVQSVAIHAGLWRVLGEERLVLPVTLGLAAGGTRLVFSQGDAPLDVFLCPHTLLDVGLGTRLQLGVQVRADLTTLTMSALVDDSIVSQTTLSPWSLGAGLRITGGWRQKN